MKRTAEKVAKRGRRHRHVRKKVIGTAERPRLAVFRSEKHMYCQVIDDERGVTLASASTVSKDLREELSSTASAEAAAQVGRVVAEKAIQLGIKQLVFDRGGFRYHGRVRALADAARAVFKEAGEAGF
jgi:large subunit ribosomal protein L18